MDVCNKPARYVGRIQGLQVESARMVYAFCARCTLTPRVKRLRQFFSLRPAREGERCMLPKGTFLPGEDSYIGVQKYTQFQPYL